jgi:hypothetical protein
MAIQKRVPYLVKKNFLVFDKKPELRLEPGKEASIDPMLPHFVQVRDVCKCDLVPKNHRLEHASPFVDLKRIPDCKSFDMSNKALTNTIRTFLRPDMHRL